MSSPYPILDNRPIDQWKVTELKEELKRRKLKSSGKKDDLIRLLDQAIRIERENAEKEARKVTELEAAKDAFNGANIASQPVVEVKDAGKVSVGSETAKDVLDVDAKRNVKVDNVVVQLDINSFAPGFGPGEHLESDIPGDNNENVAALGQEKFQEGDMTGSISPTRADDELGFQATTVEPSTKITKSVVTEVALSAQTTVTESVVTEVAVSGQELQNSGTQGENVNSNIQLENEDSKPQQENEGLKTPHGEDLLDAAAPDNQVSEVSDILGSQVKSDSISTDSISINEKIELKDNIIADNVKLELDVNKSEMMEPSSGNVAAVGGESHPMDVEEPLEEKASVDEKDDNNATIADRGKKIDSADMGYSEKLNLDRSSGDDSMEDDVLESKQIDSKDSSDEVRNRTEKNEVSVVKEESPVDVVGDGLSADIKHAHVDDKSHPVILAEKRKINDQEGVGNNEPSKRQRRWNSEGLKLPELQSPTPTSTPRDTLQPSMKRNFSRSDSAVSDDTPKERIVPPSPKSPTNSLRIDHFVRPFTLKAVQELLGKTGTFTSFWMDHIKTHCYVTYSSVEEAVETRNALYNIQWPPNNGGRPLVAEFVDPQEVKMRTEAPPPSPAAPVSTGSTTPAAAPTSQPQPSPRQPAARQQLPPPPTLPPPPPITNPAPAREQFTLPPPPPLPEKLDPPIVTLDDLFRKTKATPRIYYLPLSEEQVAAKLEARSKNSKQ